MQIKTNHCTTNTVGQLRWNTQWINPSSLPPSSAPGKWFNFPFSSAILCILFESANIRWERVSHKMTLIPSSGKWLEFNSLLHVFTNVSFISQHASQTVYRYTSWSTKLSYKMKNPPVLPPGSSLAGKWLDTEVFYIPFLYFPHLCTCSRVSIVFQVVGLYFIPSVFWRRTNWPWKFSMFGSSTAGMKSFMLMMCVHVFHANSIQTVCVSIKDLGKFWVSMLSESSMSFECLCPNCLNWGFCQL